MQSQSRGQKRSWDGTNDPNEKNTTRKSSGSSSGNAATKNAPSVGSTYRVILRLAQQLRTEKKLTDRRHAGKELLSMLADAKVRSKLHREAKSANSQSSSTKEAISSLWKVVIRNALYAAEASMESSSATKKQQRVLQPDELMLPFKLLRRSEDTRLEEDSYMLMSPNLLSGKEVLDLLNFCLNMLNDDQALQLLELDLLEMLSHLCSRPEYVVHFRLHSEINYILAEISKYLIVGRNNKVAKPDFILCAAKALSNLMSQTCTRLGLDMYLFLAPSVKLVADCLSTPDIVDNAPPLLTYYLYNAVTHLCAPHLSHCILVMEEHGEVLLRYARQIFSSLSSGVQRDAIIDYFSLHLSVCEEAGRLEGSRTLGRLGSASLDEMQLYYILSLLLSERALAKLPSSVSARTKHNTKHENHCPYFLPLSRRHRRYLELCARLLRYYQSSVVLSAKLDLVEDLTTLLVEPVEERSVLFPVSVESQSCKVTNALSNIDTPSLRSTCPWAQFISKHIQAEPFSSYKAEVTVADDTQSQKYVGESRLSTGSSATQSQARQRPLYSVGDASTEAQPTVTGSTSIVPYLQCICACAEVFPLGECWSTNVGIGQPREYGNNEGQSIHNIGRTCSPSDLSILIKLLNNLLVSHGTLGGDPGVQIWTLLSLIKLSESSLLVHAGSNGEFLKKKELSESWQLVWKSIFRQDLRYASFTLDTKENAAGELVVRLLQHIVANRCTSNERHIPKHGSSTCTSFDPCRFLYVNQHPLWCLPIFEDPKSVNSGAIFGLIITFQTVIGISEDGRDKIYKSFPRFASPADVDNIRLIPNQAKRKFSLVCFCLHFIEESVSRKCAQVKKSDLALASICMSSLLSGLSEPPLKLFEPNSFERFSCTADEYELAPGNSEEMEMSSSLFALWGHFLNSDNSDHRFDDNEHIWRNCQGFGPRLRSSYSRNTRKIAQHLRLQCNHSLSSSSPTFQSIFNFSLRCLRSLISNVDLEEEENNEDIAETQCEEFSGFWFQKRAFGLLCLLATVVKAFAPGNVETVALTEEDESLLLNFLKDYTSSIPSLLGDSAVFVEVSGCVLGILRLLSSVSKSPQLVLSLSLTSHIASLFDSCEQVLNAYGMRFGALDSKVSSLPYKSLSSKDEFTDSSGKDSDSDGGQNIPFDQSSSEGDSILAITKKNKKTKRNPVVLQSVERRTKTAPRKHASKLREIDFDTASFRVAASILATLEPSPRSCRIVRNSLLGLSFSAEEHEKESFELIDPRDINFVCRLFCNDRAILHATRIKSLYSREPTCSRREQIYKGNKLDESVVFICCNLITTARSYSRPSSIYDLFGFRWGSTMVSALSAGNEESENSDEVNKILDILHPGESDELTKKESKWAKKSITSRSSIRASQLLAVKEAFIQGNDNFHLAFDKFFASDFVLPSVSDISHKVRHHASFAVGTALRFFPNQRTIVDGIIRSLPFFLLEMETDKIDKKFDRWITEKSGKNVDMEALERRSWENAKTSLESTTTETLGIIIGETTDETIMREKLFLLLSLSYYRPQFQLICFEALCQASRIRGFSNISDFLNENLEWLLLKWINESRDLSSIPLLMCDPGLIETFQTLGIASELGRSMEMPNGSDPRKDYVHLESLCASAVQKFAKMNASFLVPIILLSKPRCANVMASSAVEIKSHRRKYFKELANLLGDACDSGAVADLISRNLHFIYAFVYPMVKADISEPNYNIICEEGTEVLQYLHSSFPRGNNTPKLSRKLTLKLLQQCVRKPPIFGEESSRSLCGASYMNAIRFAASERSENSSTAGFLEDAGISVTECLLHMKSWLDYSAVESRINRIFSTISLLFDTIIGHLNVSSAKKMQIGFCIHVFLSLITNERLRNFRVLSLRILRNFVQYVFKEEILKKVSSEISRELSRIVVCLLQVHAEAKRDHVDLSIKNQKDKSFQTERSLGLLSWLQLEKLEHYSERPINSSLANQSKDFCETMEIAHDFLSYILLESKPCLEQALLSVYPLPVTTDENLSGTAISFDNEKFCVFHLLNRFRNQFGIQELNLNSLKDEVTRFNEFVEIHLKSTNSANHTWIFHDVALNRLWVLLKQRRDALLSNPDSCPLSVDQLHVLISHLLTLCSKGTEETVRIAASRCLGELCDVDYSFQSIKPSAKWDFIFSNSGTDEGSDPMTLFKSEVLELLHHYMMSECTDTSLIAMETIRALFSIKSADPLWMSLTSDRTKAALRPLQHDAKEDSIFISIPKYFIKKLFLKTGRIDDNKAIFKNDWCWDDNFWKCETENNSSYETWIMDIVCSLIICCYRKHGHKRNKSDNFSTGHGDFFIRCIGMCAKEYAFAEFLFPFVIFDLLSSGEGTESTIPEQADATVRNMVLSDTMIGPSDSLVNKMLTQCVNRNLLKLQNEYNSKAVSLAVDTLLFLFRVMKSRFLLSEHHKKNPVNLNNRVQRDPPTSGRKSSAHQASLQGESSYNSDIEPPPVWKGVPYGVVLHLDGIEVASACLQAKRFTSGLLFADIYADNKLGGSGGVLERMAAEALDFKSNRKIFFPNDGVFDISGYGENNNKNVLSGTRCEDRCILPLQSILKTCFRQLDEHNAVLGVEAHATTLFFSASPCTVMNDINIGEGRSCLNELVSVDSLLQSRDLEIPTSISKDSVLVTKALESLGLRHVLARYITSLGKEIDPSCSNLANTTDTEKQQLKEMMSHNSWRMLLWDEGLRHPGIAYDCGRSLFKTGNLEQYNQLNPAMGFHESIRESLSCLSSGDATTYKLRLHSARLSVLQEIDCLIGSDSIFRIISSAASKFQLLNDFELLPVEAEGSQNFPTVLVSRWGLTKGDGVFPTCLNFRDEELVFSLREVAIRALWRQRAVENPERNFLICHLDRFCSVAREHGKAHIAQSCLERLSRVVQIQDNIQCVTENDFSLASMEVKLHEAKNLYSSQNYSDAIRTAKMVVSRLNQKKSAQTEIDTMPLDRVLCDSLMQLGLWISSHYRIESAKSILENYFYPASKIAESVYNRSKLPNDRENATKAHLGMAEFVAGIYETVINRVKSREWKLASLGAQQRRLELEKTREMYKEAKEKYSLTASKITNKSKSKKGAQPSVNKSAAEVLEAEAACHDVFLHLKVLEKEVEEDTKERTAIEESISKFLLSAMESYEAGLSLNFNSNTHPENGLLKHVFRLVSLWFSNEGNSNVNSVLNRISQKVPSYLFVPLTYQIFSRLDSASSDSYPSEVGTFDISFQSALRSMVLRISMEHPYHTLVQLIALANGNKVGSGVGGRQSVAYLENVGASKVDACTDVIKSISKFAPPYVASLVESYSALIESYIELAMAPTEQLLKESRHRTKDIPFSALSCASRSIAPTLDRCLGSSKRRNFVCQPCVFTRLPLLRPGCDYGEGREDPLGSELIDGFYPAFSLTETGLHRPKIVVCLGASVGSFKQLVKGEDDIRQDAIMQQVFSTVNRIFLTAAIPQLRSELQIATYTVVPLSPASGVLEWVENSLPLGNYLLDGKTVGAHSRYYPMEWSNTLCRSHFKDAPSHLKRETFDEVCRHFSPALRFFFLEKFSFSTEAWHYAKMRYTRSCAVSSMVGHLLGIGDRHLLNILICEKTGHLIHIDFGIVFEQGKCLTTPETVPFRLTRNIVDAMGPCGTEGTFSHAAEATMRLLRENQTVLLTILSAVVSDPLYKWSVSPVKARLRQRNDDGEEAAAKMNIDFTGDSSPVKFQLSEDRNDAANRAITKIQEKLQGYENGTIGECQSVEGQVQLLINAARDHDNLCSLYFGWAPWV